jgi:hypothetical protein
VSGAKQRLSESSRVVSNPCVSTLRLILASWLIAVTLIAQRGTDFSGSWVLDETPVRSAPDIPQRLVVQQPVTTTTARGAPMPPAYLTLMVTRYLGDVVQQDEYRISTVGGTVGGPGPSAGGSRYEVGWIGDSLWIYNESYTASGGNIRRRGETWRIDELGRLVISVETREKDEAVATRTLVYRRERR